MKLIKSLLIFLLGVNFLFSQSFNHPELEWKTIEGEYFIVHYHQNTEWTANEALHVADDIYPYITDLYQYKPEEKTHIIIRDTDDYANGAAYYFDNKIEIWAKPLDYELRGSHYWLRDVIAHEFTHIVSLRASRKMPPTVPAAYIQVISYEPERREDVLYGYPNGIVSYPIPSVVVPMWWAEGIAQFQSDSMRWDWWDSIRDMILRDRIKYGKLLTLNEMDGFGKVGIGNESVYDHGFSFVRYLSANYGQDVLRRITDRLSSPLKYGFYKAMEKEIGVPSQILWKEWRADLMLKQSQSFIENELISPVKYVQREGDANYYPRFNTSGNSMGFISSADETYLSRTSLFVKDSTDEAEALLPTAEGFDWSPEEGYLVYARKDFHNGGIPNPRIEHHVDQKHFTHLKTHQEATCERCQFLLSGSKYSDLFIVHRDSLKDEIQLTHGERVKNPAWAPDGKSIAFVNLRDGTNNLCLAYPAYPDSITQLTFLAPGTQVYVPRWSPDSKQIIFDYTAGSNRDIGLFDIDSDSMSIIMDEIWDERNPVFKSSNQISYSDDRTGIFNIYNYDLVSKENRRLTNVIGGAFQAEWQEDRLYYSLYDSLGFNIAVLEETELLDSVTEPLASSLERIIAPTWERHAEYKPSEDYVMQYGPMFILPRFQIEIDNSKDVVTYKPGFYFFSDEIISDYSMVGGFGLAPNLDMDLFLSAQYRGFLPTLTFEFYQMSRNTQEELWYYDKVWPADGDLTFSLTQGVLSADILIPPKHSVTLDVSASNYKSTLAAHVIQGNAIPRFSDDYFKGWDWGIRWNTSGIHIRQERGINPSGYKTSVSLRSNHHNFLDEDYRYTKLNLSGFYGYRLPMPGKIIVSNSTELNLIDNNAIDDFFYEFGGGLPGLRGYPFYSLRGTRRFVSTSSLRLPIFRNNYSKAAHLTVKDLYIGVHGQIGAAWSIDPQDVDVKDMNAWISNELNQIDMVRDIGIDFRLALNSYYAYPTAIEFGAYHGLDDISVTTNDDQVINYGNDWRFYWKVLFGFE
jgi:hypothetical protein